MVKLKKISLEEDFLSEMEMLQVYGGNMDGDVNINVYCEGAHCISGCGGSGSGSGSGSGDDDPSSNDKQCSCKNTCSCKTCNC